MIGLGAALHRNIIILTWRTQHGRSSPGGNHKLQLPSTYTGIRGIRAIDRTPEYGVGGPRAEIKLLHAKRKEGSCAVGLSTRKGFPLLTWNIRNTKSERRSDLLKFAPHSILELAGS